LHRVNHSQLCRHGVRSQEDFTAKDAHGNARMWFDAHFLPNLMKDLDVSATPDNHQN
jgi:hypothetical protein